MKVYTALIDWLTLTTFEADICNRWSTLQAHSDGEFREGKVRGYVGVYAGNLFIGTGTQLGRDHYLLRVSGEEADIIAPLLFHCGARCTRIDIQITIDQPAGYSARMLKDILSLSRRDQRRQISLIESGEGTDTVYMGNRSSERFYRIYVKLGEDGNFFLRFEVEFKGELARAVWRHVEYDASLAAILAAEIDRLGFDSMGVLLRFHAHLAGDLRVKPIHVPASDTATLRWLLHQVVPVLRRLLLSHSEGPRIRAILEDLLSNP